MAVQILDLHRQPVWVGNIITIHYRVIFAPSNLKALVEAISTFSVVAIVKNTYPRILETSNDFRSVVGGTIIMDNEFPILSSFDEEWSGWQTLGFFRY